MDSNALTQYYMNTCFLNDNRSINLNCPNLRFSRFKIEALQKLYSAKSVFSLKIGSFSFCIYKQKRYYIDIILYSFTTTVAIVTIQFDFAALL
jgi:hypothetical protein